MKTDFISDPDTEVACGVRFELDNSQQSFYKVVVRVNTIKVTSSEHADREYYTLDEVLESVERDWITSSDDCLSIQRSIKVSYNNVKLFYKLNPELALLDRTWAEKEEISRIEKEACERLGKINQRRSELLLDPLIDDANREAIRIELKKDPEVALKEIVNNPSYTQISRKKMNISIRSLVNTYASKVLDSVIERVMDRMNPAEISDEVQSRLANLIDVDAVARQCEESIQNKIIDYIVDTIAVDVESEIRENLTSTTSIEDMALEISERGLI